MKRDAPKGILFLCSYFEESKVFCVRSIKRAPIGAVIKMESTATDKITFPEASPACKGTEPMAACTVAFGK